MHRHGPSCLEGPVSRKRRRWQQAESAGADAKAAVAKSSTMNSNEKSRPRENQPIRWELVERVRREIEAGTYETDEKMERALERLMDQLQND